MLTSSPAVPVALDAPIPRPGTDADLMTLVRRGDREAFGELVERHKDGLVAYLARLTGCRDRAEDLAQEAFLKLFKCAADYRERGHLVAFLFRIATNLLRSEERRARRFRLLAPLLGAGREGRPTYEASEPAAAEARLAAAELKNRVAKELAALPLTWRAALVLSEVEDWPLAEIARALGCREGTVKSRLFRGRERLRQALGPYLNGARP